MFNLTFNRKATIAAFNEKTNISNGSNCFVISNNMGKSTIKKTLKDSKEGNRYAKFAGFNFGMKSKI
ncbi:MAG: hypothetical protein IPF62_08745 [Bacteroidetes bacterium]|nr:hypothetical protein [Bacteroidota bacterium]